MTSQMLITSSKEYKTLFKTPSADNDYKLYVSQLLYFGYNDIHEYSEFEDNDFDVFTLYDLKTSTAIAVHMNTHIIDLNELHIEDNTNIMIITSDRDFSVGDSDITVKYIEFVPRFHVNIFDINIPFFAPRDAITGIDYNDSIANIIFNSNYFPRPYDNDVKHFVCVNYNGRTRIVSEDVTIKNTDRYIEHILISPICDQYYEDIMFMNDNMWSSRAGTIEWKNQYTRDHWFDFSIIMESDSIEHIKMICTHFTTKYSIISKYDNADDLRRYMAATLYDGNEIAYRAVDIICNSILDHKVLLPDSSYDTIINRIDNNIFIDYDVIATTDTKHAMLLLNYFQVRGSCKLLKYHIMMKYKFDPNMMIMDATTYRLLENEGHDVTNICNLNISLLNWYESNGGYIGGLKHFDI